MDAPRLKPTSSRDSSLVSYALTLPFSCVHLGYGLHVAPRIWWRVDVGGLILAFRKPLMWPSYLNCDPVHDRSWRGVRLSTIPFLKVISGSASAVGLKFSLGHRGNADIVLILVAV